VAKRIGPLLVIVGETASGKSALALELAKKFDGELICADSWTVRREVNIGTAKPTAIEQADVPHHLLDVAGPDEDFTAAVFKRLALAAIDDISSRGKLPIMVGGTGLYIDGVLYDYGFLAEGDRIARRELNALTISELLGRIEKEGIALDGVDMRNKRRLIRLLETGGARPTSGKLRPNSLMVGLQVDRPELKGNIEARTEHMITAGLEREVRQLVEKYGWDCEALKGVGYKEWREYFDGSATLAETQQRIIKNTLDLAKRQRTWFKRNKSIQWISTPVNLPKVVDLVTTFLNN
jgi:tRNA dimethylallyltransferase